MKLARQLRKHMTPHEKMLWQDLRILDGFRFRRQVVIKNYIVDFACNQNKIIIELDGSQHAEPSHIENDKIRDEALSYEGYYVLRFWNFDSENERDGIIDTILNYNRITRFPLRGELSRSD